MPEEAQGRAEPSAESRSSGADGSSAVLSVLVTSSPAWIRGMVLLLLGGCIVVVVVTVCAAVFVGREVTAWPPHIAAYVPPEVRNCNSLIAALPDIRNADEREHSRLGEMAMSSMTALMNLRVEYTKKDANTVYVSTSIDGVIKDLDGLNKRLDEQLLNLRKRSDEVVAGCLRLGLGAQSK
jgi:hypothetical protein